MLLTMDILKPYIGGQLEIESLLGQYLFRGEVRSVALEDGDMIVVFQWIAERTESGEWKKTDRFKYIICLEIYVASNIGPSMDSGDDWIRLQSDSVGEIATLFPPHGNRLDPTMVKGLKS